MPKFVNINSLAEKVNPDGNEQIQVSSTQKFVWKNALMNSGGFIGAILSYATQYAMGNTTDRQTIISMLGQLFYNTGSRADSFFRFVCGSVKIPGGTPKQEYFGVVFYDAYYTRTYAVFFGFENGAVPVTFFQRLGNYVTDSPVDDNFVTNIINGTSWTKLGTLDFTAPFDMSVFATKSYVKPNDGILTTFPSGARLIIPGENLTTNVTSGTLTVKVPDLLTAAMKSGPFRDAIIDVPYSVNVVFQKQDGIVYKADNVDGFTATSGRKVYAIHFVPTTTSLTSITFRAFVNVANYK